jgi:hypothetical protein
MTKLSETLTAQEYVWAYRLRQRIVLERIVLTVGNPRERRKAKQFLEAMEQANPELFEDIDLQTPELLQDIEPQTPELFDASEYSRARGRKTALKLPKDIMWEDRTIRRAAREYRELFHPCENLFRNALKGLQYLHRLHPELFTRARVLAIEQRNQILTSDIYCQCDCATQEDRQPADSFKISDRGRFRNVSMRITHAMQATVSSGVNGQIDWQFFLNRIRDVAPEMLEA